MYFWGELDDRETSAARGGGGPLGDVEFEDVVFKRGTRPLFAAWSIVHTDAASVYKQLHREHGRDIYKHLNLSHTFVRHSRKKGEDGKMMPVQFCVRKKVKLRSGIFEWRKGGTQKKDGFWSLVRKHVSRRSTPTSKRDLLRTKAYFFQWLYWKSADPEGDAMRGRHEGLPTFDMLSALGALRRRLRDQFGDERLTELGSAWFEALSPDALENLPPCPRRLVGKQSPQGLSPGARENVPPCSRRLVGKQSADAQDETS